MEMECSGKQKNYFCGEVMLTIVMIVAIGIEE